MNINYEIEELYSSIYKIKLSDGVLFLYFHSGRIDLDMEDLETSEVFDDRYFQLFHTPAPSFDNRTWNVFVKKLLEMAQDA